MHTQSTSRTTTLDRSPANLFGNAEDDSLDTEQSASNRPANWWRLSAEAVALALLLRQTLNSRSRSRGYLAALTTAVAGAAVYDAVGTLRRRQPEPVYLRATITINRTVEEVYRYWRDFRNLAKFMDHLESVEESNGVSVWQARGPGGIPVKWEATIVADKQNERIAWRSLEGAELPNYGQVTFVQAPAGRGTEVHVEMGFEPPFGPVGAGVAKLLSGIPEQQLQNDLRRFKQVLETGDVTKSDASVHRGPHPARPANNQQQKPAKGTVKL